MHHHYYGKGVGRPITNGRPVRAARLNCVLRGYSLVHNVCHKGWRSSSSWQAHRHLDPVTWTYSRLTGQVTTLRQRHLIRAFHKLLLIPL